MTTAVTHWDKVRSSKVPDDTCGSADSHVADEWKEPSEEKKHAELILKHKNSIFVMGFRQIDTYPDTFVTRSTQDRQSQSGGRAKLHM